MRNAIQKLRTTAREAQGFTLIEVLIAMAIFSIGIMAITKMQLQAMDGTGSSRVYLDTAALAQDRLERITATSILDSSMDAGNYTDPSPPAGYTIQWTITDANAAGPVATSKTITVTVTHARGNRTTLTMVKADDEV